MAGFNPLVTILDLPYFIPADPDQAQALRTGPFGDRLLETFSEKGFAAVGFWPFGFKQITSNKPLDSIDAIEGQRFRVMASDIRSEEHTSELQSLMRISYAVFCLKTKKTYT